MIQWTIDAARQSELLDDFIVSTDDPEIADACRDLGANVPFLRPAELATDTATSQDTALHALATYKGEKAFDYLLLLQPTTPFRSSSDIDASISLAAQYSSTSVVSFTEIDTYHPYYMYFAEEPESSGSPPSVKQAFEYEVGTPRQAFPRALYRNGAIYLVRTDHLVKAHSFVCANVTPYLMPLERSINIDGKADLVYAEFLLAHGDDVRCAVS